MRVLVILRGGRHGQHQRARFRARRGRRQRGGRLAAGWHHDACQGRVKGQFKVRLLGATPGAFGAPRAAVRGPDLGPGPDQGGGAKFPVVGAGPVARAGRVEKSKVGAAGLSNQGQRGLKRRALNV